MDFACPMDYMTDDARFGQSVQKQLNLVEGLIPLYPGIGVYLLPSADRVVGQIEIARRLGADGFTLFNLTEKSASELVPAMKMGAGKQKSVAAALDRISLKATSENEVAYENKKVTTACFTNKRPLFHSLME